MDISPVNLDLPYPDTDGIAPSFYNVKCIMNDYGGPESETTAIFTYMYQAYIMDMLNPDMHHVLEEIAISEMRHHEMLGGVIVALGGDPIIAGRQGFWSAKSVNYCKDPARFLRNNIKAEEIAINNYKKSINCVTEPKIKALLERIILDEQQHIIVFNDLIKAYT